MRGIIKKTVHDRGFGFIKTPDGSEYFFHVKRLIDLDWDEESLVGKLVEFDTETGPDGRQRAAWVKPVEGGK